MEIVLTLVVGFFVGAAIWIIRIAQPRNDRGDSSSMPYSGDTTASDHVHSDHCGHGHDGGADGGGDCGGGDGGGGGD